MLSFRPAIDKYKPKSLVTTLPLFQSPKKTSPYKPSYEPVYINDNDLYNTSYQTSENKVMTIVGSIFGRFMFLVVSISLLSVMIWASVKASDDKNESQENKTKYKKIAIGTGVTLGVILVIAVIFQIKYKII